MAMDVLLTGTGPAIGFPVPDCSCAACAQASAGRLPRRRPAELRLNDRWRLDVDGTVYEPGGSPYRLRAGDRLELAGITVHAFAAEDGSAGVALLVRLGAEAPLLWSPQSGQLPEASRQALAGVELGVAILGPGPDHDPDQPQVGRPALIGCALSLAGLRSIGAVTDRTRCLLVGLGHRQGSPDRLAAALADWGVHAPLDGAREGWPGLDDGTLSNRGVRLGGRTLVLGGSSSGKSGLAEDLLAAEPEVLYTATGPVVDLRSTADAEWAGRVRRHQERRPAWWQTIETHEVAALLTKVDRPVLLDSVGTWLAGVLDRAGAWRGEDTWRTEVCRECEALVRAWRARRAPLVAVSDEVGWGVVPSTSAGRLFREELGRLNHQLADESDRVLVVVAGRVLSDGRGQRWPDH